MKTGLSKILPETLRPQTFINRIVSSILNNNPTILSGPFKGMNYLSDSVGSVLLPKIFGSYETELRAIIQTYLSDEPKVIFDIGSAEGYYAVGLAFRCPGTRVISFESDEKGRRLQKELSDKNGVSSRIEINGFCGKETFAENLIKHSPRLIVMDIEGGEAELLSKKTAPLLKKTDLLIELHPWAEPSIETVLASLFQETHKINLIEARSRCVSDLPFGSLKNILVARWLLTKLDEGRPQKMSWLHLISKEFLG